MDKWIIATKWISNISPDDWIILVDDGNLLRLYQNISEKEAISHFKLERAVGDSRIHPIGTGDF